METEWDDTATLCVEGMWGVVRNERRAGCCFACRGDQQRCELLASE